MVSLWPWKKKQAELAAYQEPTVAYVETPQLTASSSQFAPTLSVGNSSLFDAGSVLGALGTGYAHLAECSERLFSDNIYARGFVLRFVTSVINTGLLIESTPNTEVLGIDQDTLDTWTESAETAFELWGGRRQLCSFAENKTLTEIEVEAYSIALRQGDSLIVEKQDSRTGLPRYQVIPGRRVVSPIEALSTARRIEDGVESDENGNINGFWVADHFPETRMMLNSGVGKISFVPAFDETGRPIAWQVFGSPQRIGRRGEPLLALLIRSLSEIDKYRESVQRKALLTSLIAFVVTKKEGGPGTLPLTNLGGGLSRTGAAEDATVTERALKVGTFVPGAIIDEMAPGEDLKAVNSEGTDIRFSEFEMAIVDTMAWAYGIPPEVLRMKYSNNYSASQASNNKWLLAVGMIREDFGTQFVRPVYESFLISATLTRDIPDLGLLATRANWKQWQKHASWLSCEISGPADPVVDIVKAMKGYREAFELCLITRRRAARELGGGKLSRIIKDRAREDKAIREADLISSSQTYTVGENPPAQLPAPANSGKTAKGEADKAA